MQNDMSDLHKVIEKKTEIMGKNEAQLQKYETTMQNLYKEIEVKKR